MRKLIFLISVLFVLPSMAGLLFNYSQLAIKDLDQMSAMIKKKIEESRKSKGDKVIPLKESLQAVYSRPNGDLLIEKVVSPLKAELEQHDAWESAFKALVKEAIGALKNPKSFTPKVQATYWIFLENTLSEMKPKVATDDFERSVVVDIRNAKIKLSKEAQSERRLGAMKSTVSPSEVAEQILEPLGKK